MNLDAIHIEHAERLGWLWLVAAVGAIAIIGVVMRQRQIARFADPKLIGKILPGWSRWRSWLRTAIGIAALLVMIPALIDVRWGYEERTVRRHGIDVVILLDLSQSMLAADARPTRLDRARRRRRKI